MPVGVWRTLRLFRLCTKSPGIRFRGFFLGSCWPPDISRACAVCLPGVRRVRPAEPSAQRKERNPLRRDRGLALPCHQAVTRSIDTVFGRFHERPGYDISPYPDGLCRTLLGRGRAMVPASGVFAVPLRPRRSQRSCLRPGADAPGSFFGGMDWDRHGSIMQVTRRQTRRQWSPVNDPAKTIRPVAVSAETGPAEKKLGACGSATRLARGIATDSSCVAGHNFAFMKRPRILTPGFGRPAYTGTAVWPRRSGRHALVGGFRYPRKALGLKFSSPALGVYAGPAVGVLLPGRIAFMCPAWTVCARREVSQCLSACKWHRAARSVGHVSRYRGVCHHLCNS